MADCSNGAQSPDWCPTTAAEVMPSVLGVLPSGPAWDGGAQPGTVMNMFWTAVADVLAGVYARLCAYMLEFLCSTAVESVDQWQAEYGLPDQCDPFGYNLCAKVNALFEPNCDGYVAIAAANGWVIECANTSLPEPIAGCFQCGCTPLGPKPEYLDGSNIGVGALSPCDYGQVVQHPQPQFWNNTFASQANCPVPGTNLGFGPDTAHGEQCCFIVGWAPAPEMLAPTVPVKDACVGGDTIYFDCPTYVRPRLVFKSLDSTGKFTNYSQAYVWSVTVNLPASLALQGKPVATGPTSQAGAFEAGCTPLCSQSVYADMLCFLQTIAPAHTVLLTNVSTTI